MRRPLTLFRLLVCVPLGVLWLGVLAALAVPVVLYMTVLYHILQAGRALLAGGRSAPDTEREEA